MQHRDELQARVAAKVVSVAIELKDVLSILGSGTIDWYRQGDEYDPYDEEQMLLELIQDSKLKSRCEAARQQCEGFLPLEARKLFGELLALTKSHEQAIRSVIADWESETYGPRHKGVRDIRDALRTPEATRIAAEKAQSVIDYLRGLTMMRGGDA